MTDQLINEIIRQLYVKFYNDTDAMIFEDSLTEREIEILHEMNLRSEINLCLTYGRGEEIYNVSTDEWGARGKEYGLCYFSPERAREIWENQMDFFRNHASVHLDFILSDGTRIMKTSWH